MHIGLNLVYLTVGSTGGTEVVAQELLPELVAAAPEHRFTAFVNRDAADAPGPWSELMGSITVPVRAMNRLEWVRGEQLLLPRLAAGAGVALLHSLANTGPAWGRFRRVVTVHDLINSVVPEARAGLRSVGMRVLVPLAARSAQRVIVDSATTGADLQRVVGVPPDRIDVVPLGVGSLSRKPPLPSEQLRHRLDAGDRPIILSVSAKLPHKNLPRLIGALALIDPASRPLLVLPGYPTPHEDQLRARAAEEGVAEDVRFLGWVSEEELEGLYAAASAFVFPSLYEGFGLPVLEAMARRLPVACSDRGSLKEVSGDAALHFDPQSETAIAQAIERLLGDPALRDRLAKAGVDRAATFSWRATALGTLRAYERAMAAP